jgi:hypothetical protein
VKGEGGKVKGNGIRNRDSSHLRGLSGLLIPFTLHLSLFTLALPQAPAPRYLPSQFSCSAFQEVVSGDVRGEAGRAVRQERLGRIGVLVVRGDAADSDSLEAWFDTLQVWREGPEGRIEPDTEGLLGGRWIGRLSASGIWREEQTPFVPDEVVAVMDLRMLLREFFPILPAVHLRVGAADSSGGSVIRRERDVAGAHRYSWRVQRQVDTVAPLNDSLEVAIQRDIREEGTMLWSPDRGPLRWTRTIGTTVRPSGGSAKTRGVVTQRITVVRIRAYAPCEAGPGGSPGDW